MTDPRPHQPFADLLLEQETRVSEAQLGEYRCKLQRRLAEAARHERRMRAATFGTAAVVLLGSFYFLVASSLGPPGVDPLQHLFNLFPEPARHNRRHRAVDVLSDLRRLRGPVPTALLPAIQAEAPTDPAGANPRHPRGIAASDRRASKARAADREVTRDGGISTHDIGDHGSCDWSRASVGSSGGSQRNNLFASPPKSCHHH